MSNNSIKERFNNILNKGADRWLTRSLFEEDGPADRMNNADLSNVPAANRDDSEPPAHTTARQNASAMSQQIQARRGASSQQPTTPASTNSQPPTRRKLAGTEAKEVISLYAIKRHIQDKAELNDDFDNDIRSRFDAPSLDKRIISARNHASAFKKVLEDRGFKDEDLEHLRFGRGGSDLAELEDVLSTRYGERNLAAFKELPKEVRKQLYYSHMKDSWNPADIDVIDGRIEEDYVKEVDRLKLHHGDDHEGFIRAVNALGRDYIKNNQLFPLSLKEVYKNDAEPKAEATNTETILNNAEDSARLAMIRDMGVSMNLDLFGDGFQSQDLNIPISLGLTQDIEGGESIDNTYDMNMRIQEQGGASNVFNPVRQNYRSEPMPAAADTVDAAGFNIQAPDKPRFDENASKYDPLTLPQPSSAQKNAMEALDRGEEISKAKQKSVDSYKKKLADKEAENEKRSQQREEDRKEYEKATKEFEEREIEANKTSNKKVSFGSESKIGMVPSEFLREAVGKLIEDPTQLLNMATNEDGSFRDFDEDEINNLRGMIRSIYSADYDDNFRVNTPDLQIGNKTYSGDTIPDYINDLATIDKESRGDDKTLTNELFGEGGISDDQLQNKTRLILMKMMITHGLVRKNGEGGSALPKALAEIFMRGSKSNDNIFHPHFKLDRERKINESIAFLLDYTYSFVLQYN